MRVSRVSRRRPRERGWGDSKARSWWPSLVRGVATSGGEEVILSTRQLFVVALKKLVVARTDSAHRPACSGGMPDPASESRAERLLRRY